MALEPVECTTNPLDCPRPGGNFTLPKPLDGLRSQARFTSKRPYGDLPHVLPQPVEVYRACLQGLAVHDLGSLILAKVCLLLPAVSLFADALHR